mgnify:CR=1 FL=1
MNGSEIKKATFGGGCFWCLEAVFQRVKGVCNVVSGYAGGQTDHPEYEAVCSGLTGHAEVVQVTFDPKIIDFSAVLEHFWTLHDPTTLNRQGNDVGTQYRSAIFFHSEKQRAIAEKSKKEKNEKGVFHSPIVTEIAGLEKFYPAEEYHQQYYRRNADQPYCQVIVAPKVAKFRMEHVDKLKSEATSAPL